LAGISVHVNNYKKAVCVQADVTQTLPRTVIEQEGFQGVLSDGGGRKYQLKKKRGKMVTFCRGQLQKFCVILDQIFRSSGCKLAIFVHKQIARFFCAKNISNTAGNGVALRSCHFDPLES